MVAILCWPAWGTGKEGKLIVKANAVCWRNMHTCTHVRIYLSKALAICSGAMGLGGQDITTIKMIGFRD